MLASFGIYYQLTDHKTSVITSANHRLQHSQRVGKCQLLSLVLTQHWRISGSFAPIASSVSESVRSYKQQFLQASVLRLSRLTAEK